MMLQDNQPSPEMIQHIMVAMMAIIPLIIIISIAIVMVPCWFILKKAGFSPWLCSAVPDTDAGHAGAAVCAGVCRVEGFRRRRRHTRHRIRRPRRPIRPKRETAHPIGREQMLAS